MAVALAEDGAFSHADFQQALIAAIAEWDALGQPVANYRYYECWLSALEHLAQERTSTQIADIDQRAENFLARPAGHDHDHDHHGHHH